MPKVRPKLWIALSNNTKNKKLQIIIQNNENFDFWYFAD